MISIKKIGSLVFLVAIFIGCNPHQQDKNKDLVLTDSTTKTRMDEIAEGLPTEKSLKDSFINLYEGIDTATINKAWLNYSSSGTNHKMLDSLSGTWQTEFKFYQDGVDTAQTIKMSATISPVLNGLYQQTLHRGKIMDMPYEGRAVLGFNKASKQFEYTWLDNFSSGMLFLTGKMDSLSKQIVLTGSLADPVTGKDIGIRQTIEIINNKEQRIKLYDTKNNIERLSMEIILQKK